MDLRGYSFEVASPMAQTTSPISHGSDLKVRFLSIEYMYNPLLTPSPITI